MFNKHCRETKSVLTLPIVSVPVRTALKFGYHHMQRKIIVFWHQLLSVIIFILFRTLVESLGISQLRKYVQTQKTLTESS